MSAKWIWLKGDFELYHNLLLHARRRERMYIRPPVSPLAPVSSIVYFRKTFSANEAFSFKIVSKCSGYASIGDKRFGIGDEIRLDAGEYDILIYTMSTAGLPCIFIDSPYLVTDESWTASETFHGTRKAGRMPDLTKKTDDPQVFPFSYKKILPVKTEKVDDGILFDYGDEEFCRVTAYSSDSSKQVGIYYGESREEATDFQNSLVCDELKGKKKYALGTHAFRYIFLRSDADVKLKTEYEYLPIKDIATFDCGNERVKKIWDACVKTFHLCTREFFLDGIKRDRWVWSGDAYQSYLINNYLFFNNEVSERTMIALLGKPPYLTHINRINDYSMYLIIAFLEYYENTGNEDFIRDYFDRISALYEFIDSRKDENGYICAREGDWIFIDWSDMDKSGPIAAEQILFWRTKQAMAKLSELCGLVGTKYEKEAAKLKKNIMRDFWDDEKNAFIDCAVSGKRHVTRHANVFAVLYDFVTEAEIESIRKNVLQNDNITHITTPYFEFFELYARAKLGDIDYIQEKIASYWGGMIDIGATTIWEEFTPGETNHYSMYSDKYGRSLCHAWGSGPICLFGRYMLGVRPTDIGYKTFTIEPKLGHYKYVCGDVPLPSGKKVSVFFDGKKAKVKAEVEGGTLILDCKKYLIPANKTVTVTI